MENYRLALNSCLYFFSIFFLLNGCSSSNETAPQVYTVEIIQMKFQPEELRVQKGDTIIFINNDIVAHDATEINNAWKSPELASGDSWKMVVTESWDYYCSIHLVMKGEIIVE